MTLLALLLALVAQAQAPPRDARTAAVAGSGAIAGVVLSDETRPRPLRHAQVTVSGGAIGMARTVITADNGSFTVPDLGPGAYDLSANKGAYVTMYYGAVRPGLRGRTLVVKAGETARVTIRLPRGAVITGTVTDADGQPAQGIAVLALARRYGPFMPGFAEAGSPALPTDDHGTYRVYGLPAGDYVVAAQPQARAIGFLPGESMRLAAQAGPADRLWALAEVFYPSVTDITRAARITVRAGEERSGVDVQLQYVPLASVSGTARADAAWRDASINLFRMDEIVGTQSVSTRARADGSFSLGGIAPGQYRVTATTTPVDGASGLLTGSADVAIGGDDVTDLAIPLQPGLVFAGRAVFDGQRPTPGQPLEFAFAAPTIPRPGITGFPAIQLDAEGRFRASGIVPGSYRFASNGTVAHTRAGGWWLTSLVGNGVDLLDGPVDFRQSIEDAVATFTDSPNAVSGTVANAAGGIVAGAAVIVFSPDRATWFRQSRRIAAQRTGDDGRFAIRNLPPGDYRVVATTDLEDDEWFEPAVLERLLPQASTLAIDSASVGKTVTLTIR